MNVVLCEFDLNFQGKTFQILISQKMMRVSIKTHSTGMTFYESWYSSPNGITTNVVLGDHDLNFQGQTFETLISRKRREIEQTQL